MSTANTSQRTDSQPGYLATVPPEEILPVIDSKFETSVRGIYVIGDATGFPLVKIAANQGYAVIDQMSQQKESEALSTSEFLDVVIVGGGPAGISAAIEAHKRGWKYLLLERSSLASTVGNFPPGKMVYAEPRQLTNQSELDCEDDLEKDSFLKMVQDKVKSKEIRFKEQAEVTQIRRNQDGGFDLKVSDGKLIKCAKVIIAIGRQGQPKILEVPGADNSTKVTYRFHTAEDYVGKKILVVGGGNSAIETALMLSPNNDVTISYRGNEFFRAKEENRSRIEQAADNGTIQVLFDSNVSEIRDSEVDLVVDGQKLTLPNDQVVIQIGTLPPIDFLRDTGIELDGIWTKKRIWGAVAGLVIGILIYFFAKYFALVEAETIGSGRWLVQGLAGFAGPLKSLQAAITYLLPIPWLILLGLATLNKSLAMKNKKPLYKVPASGWILFSGILVYYINWSAPYIFTLDPNLAGPGPYYLPGFEWLFAVVPTYFAGLGGFYYLIYFCAIAFFGLYWAIKINHPVIWKRNLTVIAVQWTLWWGIPTFLVVFLGTNPWTPLLSRSINAWPLKMDAFDVDPSIVRPGDPEWWYIVGVVSVVWAVVLTFVVIPIFTIKFGKVYCSYICSCGALAETVGNSFRHRGPKGDAPRRWEKFGYVFVVLAAIATIASLIGWEEPRAYYNIWVGTFLAGALAIGLYPFLGQRLWCRMWCPLAFWMNFWGRWSKFKITPEKGKCIDCNMCNQYCQMGIDIKSRALQGKPVTLVDTPCVACSECVVRCPMEILHIGEVPENRLHKIGSVTSPSTEAKS